VLVNPKFEAPTAEMRAVLPKMVPMVSAINNSAMGGSLVGLTSLYVCIYISLHQKRLHSCFDLKARFKHEHRTKCMGSVRAKRE